jgi:hypothetical protein
MRIARVFPSKTNMSPTDEDCYFGAPDLFTPKYDEVHISTVFTWDIKKAKYLAECWLSYAKFIRVDGPAFDNTGEEFVSGKYLKPGITITSRGCPSNCDFCFVPGREGKIRELPIVEGNNIQDNNLLACSTKHLNKVFRMLSTQKQIDFGGGLEAARITDKIAEKLRALSICQMWLAYDVPGREKVLLKAVERLKKYFKRRYIRCYVLIGYENDTIEKAEQRLKWTYQIGMLPFAMLYQPKNEKRHYTKAWMRFTKVWCRPAAINTIMKGEESHVR